MAPNDRTMMTDDRFDGCRPPCGFISGHLDLTAEEFKERYVPALLRALDLGCSFVVGDAHGCDFMAQRWLWLHCPVDRKRGDLCRVFHMLERPRHSFNSGFGSRDPNVAPSGRGFPLVGGFPDDESRDAAMTAASWFDIAWVRPGRESSGTARNLQRRSAAQPPSDLHGAFMAIMTGVQHR